MDAIERRTPAPAQGADPGLHQEAALGGLSAVIACLAIAAGACGDSSKREAYRNVARVANPLLTALRPAAAQLLSLRPEDHAAIVDACTGSDDALKKLRDVRFDDPRIWTDPREPLVSDPAAWLLDHRSLMCKPDNGDPTRLVRCSEWCRETWTHMIDAVARLRDAAKAEGVDIVLLWP